MFRHDPLASGGGKLIVELLGTGYCRRASGCEAVPRFVYAPELRPEPNPLLYSFVELHFGLVQKFDDDCK